MTKFYPALFLFCILLSSCSSKLSISSRRYRPGFYANTRHSAKSDNKKKPAGDSAASNSIYVEALGQAIDYSFSYDHLFRTNKRIKHSFSIGAEYLNLRPDGPNYVSPGQGYMLGLPVAYNFVFGQRSNYFETGLGLTGFYNKEQFTPGVASYGSTTIWDAAGSTKSYYLLCVSPTLGYRHQSLKGGLFFKVDFTLILPVEQFNQGTVPAYKNQYNIPGSNEYFPLPGVLPWVGISVGYTFKRRPAGQRSFYSSAITRPL